MRAWMAGLALLALAGCHRAEPQGFGEAPAEETREPRPSMPALPHPGAPVVRIVALGDSLLAGYGLRPDQAYPSRLQAALRRAGLNAEVVNSGVSGDTAEDGAARIGFALGQGPAPALVLVSLGGNDMLRGIAPAQTKAHLEALLAELDKRHIRAVLLGMLAAPNMGPDYARDFNAIYPALAKKHHAALLPFFLAPINGKAGLQQADHIHPTPEGVEAMVEASLPVVKGALPAPR